MFFIFIKAEFHPKKRASIWNFLPTNTVSYPLETLTSHSSDHPEASSTQFHSTPCRIFHLHLLQLLLNSHTQTPLSSLLRSISSKPILPPLPLLNIHPLMPLLFIPLHRRPFRWCILFLSFNRRSSCSKEMLRRSRRRRWRGLKLRLLVVKVSIRLRPRRRLYHEKLLGRLGRIPLLLSGQKMTIASSVVILGMRLMMMFLLKHFLAFLLLTWPRCPLKSPELQNSCTPKVVRDKRTGKTKGYGFISFANVSDLAAALKEMNGKYVGNRPIKLRKSNWKERIDFDALQRQKNYTPRKPKNPKKSVLHK